MLELMRRKKTLSEMNKGFSGLGERVQRHSFDVSEWFMDYLVLERGMRFALFAISRQQKVGPWMEITQRVYA